MDEHPRVGKPLRKPFIDPPFISACSKGDNAEALALLDRGVDVDVQNTFGRTALFKASGYGQAATVKLLLSRGASLFLKDSKGYTALDWARLSRRPEVTKILEKAMLDRIHERQAEIKEQEYWEELKVVIRLNEEYTVKMRDALLPPTDLKLVAQLATEGPDKKKFLDAAKRFNLEEKGVVHFADYCTRHGWSPLTKTAASGDVLKVNALLRHGAEVDLETRMGHTALTWASSCGYKDVAMSLLWSKADINRPTNREGKTGLIHAAIKGHHILVQYYLDRITEMCQLEEAAMRERAAHIQSILERDNEARDLEATKEFIKKKPAAATQKHQHEHHHHGHQHEHHHGHQHEHHHGHEHKHAHPNQHDEHVHSSAHGAAAAAATAFKSPKSATKDGADKPEQKESLEEEPFVRLTPMERVKHVNELKELQESDWVSLLEKIVHKEDTLGYTALEHAREKSHPHCVTILENVLQRCEEHHARLEADKKNSQLMECQLGCGFWDRADMIEHHETNFCMYRIIKCPLNCGERFKKNEEKNHLENRCVKREVLCTNSYFGCRVRLPEDKRSEHEANHCKFRMVPCRLGCDKEMRHHKRLEHEYKYCSHRIVKCELCKKSMQNLHWAKTHITEECDWRLVPCPLCKDYVFAIDLQAHIEQECTRPCKWGCKERIGPKAKREEHEQHLCPLRIVPCRLGCGITGLKAKDRKKHEAEECKRRVELCRLGCGKWILSENAHKHYDGTLGTCPKRVVRCPLDLSTNKRIKIRSRRKWLNASVQGYRMEDRTYRLVIEGIGTRWQSLDGVYYMPVQGSQWVCRCVRAENVDHHINHLCPLFPVMCPQGCGQRMERRLVPSHIANECPMREVSCPACGEKRIPFNSLSEHMEHECIKRKVRCVCGKFIVSDILEQHEKLECVRTLIRCSIGCGTMIERRNMDHHLKEQCPKREVPCPLGCDEKHIWFEDADEHCKTTCLLRPVDCRFGCGEMLVACEVEEHEAIDCVMRTMDCPLKCREVTDTPGKRKFVPEFASAPCSSVAFNQLETHMKFNCPMALVPCALGCGNKVLRHEVQQHETDDCPQRQVMCDLGCGQYVLYNRMPHHRDTQCPFGVAKCRYGCGTFCRRINLDAHMAVCERRVIPCGGGWKGCQRQVVSWLYGDWRDGNGEFVICEPHKESVLTYAAARGDVQLLNFVLERTSGKDIDHHTLTGKTPLIYACENGNTKCAEMLLRHGADVNLETSHGYTAMLVSVENNHFETIELLIHYYVDLISRNSLRMTPLRLAKRHGFIDISTLINMHTIIKTRQQKLFFHILHDDFDGVQAIVKGGRLHETNHVAFIRTELIKCQKDLRDTRILLKELVDPFSEAQRKFSKFNKIFREKEAEANKTREAASKLQTKITRRWKNLDPTKIHVVKLLTNIKERHVQEVARITKPPPAVSLIMRGLLRLLKIKSTMIRDPRGSLVKVADWWGPAQKLLEDHGNTINGGAFFPQYLQFYDVKQISEEDAKYVREKIVTHDDFDYVAGDEGYRLVEAVSQWMALACDQEETARLTKSWQIEVNMMSKRYRRLIEKIWPDHLRFKRAEFKFLMLSDQIRENRKKEKSLVRIIGEKDALFNTSMVINYRAASDRGGTSFTGHTGMTWAACFNNTQLLHLLWKHGATINHEDILLNAAASCIQYVFRFYHWKQTREPWTPKLSHKYLSKDILYRMQLSVLRKGFYRVMTTARAPLLDAFFNGNLEAANWLLERKANPFITSYARFTAPMPLAMPPSDIPRRGFEKKPKGVVPYDIITAAEEGLRIFGSPTFEFGQGWLDHDVRHVECVERAKLVMLKARKEADSRLRRLLDMKTAAKRGRELAILHEKLQVAIHMCKYDEIIELLEAGAKADFETDTGYTALIMAAGRDGYANDDEGVRKPMVCLLLDREDNQAHVDHESSELGHTALTWAAHKGQTHVVEMLLRRYAEVDRLTRKDGTTALIHAAKNNNSRAVNLLLEWGADEKILDREGFSAMDWARQKNYVTVCRQISFHRMRFFGNVQLGKGSSSQRFLCKWGCGQVLIDENNSCPQVQEAHDKEDCPRCAVPCPLGCDVKNLWRQDLRAHTMLSCPRRHQKCEHCKELVPAAEMEDHIKNHCSKRLIPCPLLCGHTMIAAELKEHMEQDCFRRMIRCQACRRMHEYRLKKVECPETVVKCSLGCGRSMRRRLMVDHERRVCTHRMIPCKWQCGEALPAWHWTRHVQLDCKLRLVECDWKCGKFVRFCDMEQHQERKCVHRWVECPLQCGQKVRAVDLRTHLKKQCAKRSMDCPNGCGVHLKAEQMEEHCKKLCRDRLIPCGNGCGELVKARLLKKHKHDLCAKRIVGCLLGCDLRMHADKVDDHCKYDCRRRMIFCTTGCGEQMMAQYERGHGKSKCPMRFVKCRFGCSETFRWIDTKAHEEYNCVRLKTKFNMRKSSMQNLLKDIKRL